MDWKFEGIQGLWVCDHRLHRATILFTDQIWIGAIETPDESWARGFFCRWEARSWCETELERLSEEQPVYQRKQHSSNLTLGTEVV